MAVGDSLPMTREYEHTRKTAILSRKIRNLISDFLTHKFSDTFKVLNHSARKWFKFSNLNWYHWKEVDQDR